MTGTGVSDPQRWFLCEHPERPVDKFVLMHLECPACVQVIRITAMSKQWHAPIAVEKALRLSGPGGKKYAEELRNAE